MQLKCLYRISNRELNCKKGLKGGFDMICPDCKKEVSEDCAICPSCGYPLEALAFAEKAEAEQRETKQVDEHSAPTAGKVCRISAIILGVIVFFVGIVAGYTLAEEYDEFTCLPMFIVWITGYLSCLFLYVIGRIAENIQDIRDCAMQSYSSKEKK